MTSTTAISGPALAGRAHRVHLNRIMWAWFFGAGWVALVGGAPMFRFAERMGLKQYAFTWGLLSAMPYVATLFQLIGSYWIERTQRRKSIFFVANLVQRLSWMLIALLPFLVLDYRTGAIVSVLGMVLFQAIGGQVATPAWTSWMADTIPPALRGRYFGRRIRLGLYMFIVASLVSGWLLNASETGWLKLPWPHPGHWWAWRRVPFGVSTLHLCSILFVAAAILGSIDILFFTGVPDEPKRRLQRPPSLREIFGPPLRDRQFVRFLVFYSVFIVGAPGIGNYIWLYALHHLHVTDLWAQIMFMVSPAFGEMIFASTWGRLIDRFGRKTVWVIASIFPAILPACWILIQPDYWWLGMTIPFLGAMFWSGVEQCNFNSLLHFASGREGSSSYQAIFALAIAIAGTLSGLLFGGLAWLAGPVHFRVGSFSLGYLAILFAVATAIRLGAYVILLPRVHDDGREPARVAIRYVFANLYSTIYTALSFPLRLFGANLRNGSYSPAETADSDEGPSGQV